MAGERDDALSRVDDLIAMVPSNAAYYVVQVRTRHVVKLQIPIFVLGIYVSSPWKLTNEEQQL